MKAAALVAIALAMTACGGDDDFHHIGSPQTIVVDSWGTTAITHPLNAGTYELRVTGEISCQLSPTVVTVAIPVDFATAAAGEPEASYEFIDCDPVKFTQRVTYSLTAPGQAFVQIYHPPLSVGEPAASILVRDLQLSLRSLD